VYKTVKQRIVKKPASTHKVQIPAEYANVTKTAKVSEGRLEWRSVLCQVNMTKPNVTKLQNALQRAGYYKGPIDGIIGPQTLGASNAYAKHKGLPTGSNYIATTVASSLGLTK
jgi:peptidoglycan hydrolase-like protein with peptidoglycan-binding domain